MRFRLRCRPGVNDKRDESGAGQSWQDRGLNRGDCANRWEIGAPGGAEARASGLGAVVFAIAAAAGREFGIRIRCEQRRGDQRKAEQDQQEGCEGSAH